MTNVWFLRQALADLRTAFGWYEEQQAGLGDDFFDVVDAAVESIALFPTARPVVYHGTRRCLLERFPYCLYYRVHHDEAVIIVACLHAALDPGHHQSRLHAG